MRMKNKVTVNGVNSNRIREPFCGQFVGRRVLVLEEKVMLMEYKKCLPVYILLLCGFYDIMT